MLAYIHVMLLYLDVECFQVKSRGAATRRTRVSEYTHARMHVRDMYLYNAVLVFSHSSLLLINVAFLREYHTESFATRK